VDVNMAKDQRERPDEVAQEASMKRVKAFRGRVASAIARIRLPSSVPRSQLSVILGPIIGGRH
jgi:hypothetical protein